MSDTDLPLAEQIKRESRYLRGSLRESLADEATGALRDADTHLSKFHGFYQQDDRDLREERRQQKLEPHFQFMLRLRLPGGVITPEQWWGLDRIADEYADGSLRLTTRQSVSPRVQGGSSIADSGSRRPRAGQPWGLRRRKPQCGDQRQPAPLRQPSNGV